jgi:chemotaxis protein MotB
MKRNKWDYENQEDDQAPGGNWEIVYSGFALIMLCFFIMLCSFSSVQEAKVMRFTKAFLDAVNIVTGGLKFDQGARVLPLTPDMVVDQSDFVLMMERIKEYSVQKGFQGDLEMEATDNKLVMRFRDRLIFDLGSARISDEARPLLDVIAEELKRHPDYPVTIEGHTDNLPIFTAEYPSNWELSVARAVTVLRYLNEKQNIPSERLSAAGYGEYNPIADNDTPEGRSRNRRVEITLRCANPE